LAFGGAGPVHACAVGALLQSTVVIFPPQASVLSAFGSLVTPVRLDLVRSALSPLASLNWAEVDRLVGEMLMEAEEALTEAGAPRDRIRTTIGADLRYVGQQNEVSVSFTRDPRDGHDLEAIGSAFETAYHAQYGVNPSHVPIEVVSWRLTARGPETGVEAKRTPPGAPASPRGERVIPLWSGAPRARLYDRAALSPGQAIAGPALIEERETTVVLPPAWVGTMDAIGCISATRSDG
jgi:N-methylhydantoinase A